MASEEMGLVPPQPRLDSGLSSQLVFQDQGLRFGRAGDPGQPKTRELSGFIDERFFRPRGAAEFPRSLYGDEHRRQESRSWDGNGRASTTPSGDVSEGDEEEEDEVDEGDGVDGSDGKNDIGNGPGECANADSIENGKSKSLSYVGSNRGVIIEEGNVLQSGNDNGHAIVTPDDNHHHQGRVNQYHQNAVTVADPNGDFYYSQYLQGSEGLGSGQKGVEVENGSGSSGRKEVLYSSESGDSLRVILSDPLTGTLMDDAMILPCGHSFGGDGIQHVLRMKACYTCSELVSEESVSPNLSLRAAVQAFHREEELQVYRSSKRRREKFEQDKSNYGDSMTMDHQRSRGVQFPFAVTDRVIIKGNKRTPQRFVGREAVVTTQCLNGWYVVKTLDNAESVKLQYRSLSKAPDNLSLKSATSKMTPNWP